VSELGLQLKPVFTDAKKIWELHGDRLEFTGDVPPLPWGTLLDLPHLMGKIDDLAKRVGPSKPWEYRQAADLDATTVGQWVTANSYTNHTRDLVTCSLRAVFGADPDELSMLYLAYYTAQGDSLEMLTNTKGGAQDSIIIGGSQQMSQRLAQRLGAAVHLGQPARAVHQDDDGVDVISDSGLHLRGRFAVIAMPPSAANRILFDPVLPHMRRELQARTPMGRYYKVIVTYSTAFWRNEGFSGEVASARGPVIAAYDDDPGDGTGALICFIGGDAAYVFRNDSAGAAGGGYHLPAPLVWPRRAEPHRLRL
jgi:monoamine oxidase